MSARNKFFIVLGVVFAISFSYYWFSTPRTGELDLIGIVDANQVIVSPQVAGRISKLLVEEGSRLKTGDLVAVLDASELEAQARAAAATIDSLRSQVMATEATSVATQGSTSSSVANAQARLESARAQLVEAEAMLQRVSSDSRRTVELAAQGVASDQDRVQAESNLKAQQAVVASLNQQVSAAQADLNMAVANTHQAHAAASTVRSTRAQLLNAEAQLKEAEVRLGYTKIYAPVSGTVSVRAARQGEFLNPGQAIVTIVDFTDTWVRAAIPETEADHIGFGDTVRIRMPGGTVTSGKVFFKSPEADFATQRDVSRRKRDIKTIVLKIRLENPKGAYVPGMTADVLLSAAQLKASASNQSVSAQGTQP
ncbi:MAG: efflux RND transporter periplasmic adaptor subunit [Acidobacteria bacterium]|nr:efflux RND transporter periplasmic adaptor subunit [Acidobacteriota bacterium]